MYNQKDVEDSIAPSLSQRNNYDLSHLSFQVGKLGRLQTVSCVPIVAGDSMQMDLNAICKLSALRKPMLVDTRVDLYAFYIPYRHIYGSNWTDFIKAGYDEGVTLGTDTLSTLDMSCLGYKLLASTAYPRWLTRGYIQIWNAYFRDPSSTTGVNASQSESLFTTLTDTNTCKFGLRTNHLKRLINSGVLETVDDSDKKVTLTDTNTKFSLLDMALQQARLKTEMQRDHFATSRYRDVMSNIWNSYQDYNVDQRPELIAHSTNWLSGYDIEGTDSGNLGRVIGRAVSLVNLKFPKKFFPEHGTLWVMAQVRFPTVYFHETHYLVKQSEPTYSQIAGDPEIIANTSPVSLTIGNLIGNTSSSTSLGYYPYAQWYREQPHFCHSDYVGDSGWPFYDSTPSAREDALIISDSTYDDVFQTEQLAHWQMNADIKLNADRFIPDPKLSLFAGTR